MTDTPLPWATSAADDGRLPAYGSPAWHALPDTDPRRQEALVLAAECWRTYTDPAEIERRLHYELAGFAEAAENDQIELAARVEESNRRTVAQVTGRMRRRPDEDFQARPMVQTDDWPTVVLATHPSPAEMLTKLARH